MNIQELLNDARDIWGNDRMKLSEIVVRLMVGVGDLARAARDGVSTHDENGDPVPREEIEKKIEKWRAEVKKELGNLIFSTIRWCDDQGFSPEECIEAAKEAQRAFVASGRAR